MIALRNNLMHLWISNINTSYETLNYCFTFFIPIIERNFPNDLDKIFNMIWYWDWVIFEGYLIEQLDIDKIPYSKYIKENFLIE